VTFFLSLDPDLEGMTPGFYLVDAPQNTALCVDLKPEKIKMKAPFREGNESNSLQFPSCVCSSNEIMFSPVVKTEKFEPGKYNIIPCTYKIGQEAQFELSVWTEFGAAKLSPIKAGVLHVKVRWIHFMSLMVLNSVLMGATC